MTDLFFEDQDDFVDLAEVAEGEGARRLKEFADVGGCGLTDDFFFSEGVFVDDGEYHGGAFFEGECFADVGKACGEGVLLFGGADGLVADTQRDDDIGAFEAAKPIVPRFASFFGGFDLVFDDTDLVNAFATRLNNCVG